MKHLFIFFLLIISYSVSIAQKRLPRAINSSSDRDYAPSISADNRMLVFLREYEMGPTYSLFQSRQLKSGVWNRAVEIEFYRALIKLVYKPGFSLSADGNSMYFSCRKSPGVGRFDIWYSKKKNGNWSTPLNYAKPLNSASNDVCPTVSTDEKTMYFIKGTKEANGVISGDIYIAQKKGANSWVLPTKLQGNGVNTGNETQPTILSDNKTLVFSSNRPGGKGGYDLYLSRLENGTWSSPQNLEFINTSGDDFDYAVPGKGDIAYFNKKYEEQSYDLFMTKIPEKFQQKKITLLEGKLKNGQGSLYVFDAETNKQIQKVKTDAKGNYFLTLTEGKTYDVCYYPSDKTYGFYSELYDVRRQEKYKRQKKDITFIKIESENSFILNNVYFNNNSETVADFSTGELTRLARTLKFNPQKNIILKYYFSEYEENSIQTSGLTEVIYDTLKQIQYDTLQNKPLQEEVQIDTVINVEITAIYHNNKTQQQLESIKTFLIEKGIPSNRIKIEGITECDKSRVEVYFE